MCIGATRSGFTLALGCSQQIALPFNIGDEPTPAVIRCRPGGKRDGDRAHGSGAANRVPMLHVLRQIEEPTCTDIDGLVSTAERQLAVEDVEDLVLSRVGMVRRLLSFLGSILGEGY